MALPTTSNELLAHTRTSYQYAMDIDNTEKPLVDKFRAAMRSQVNKGTHIRVDHVFATKQKLSDGSHLVNVQLAALDAQAGKPIMFNGLNYNMVMMAPLNLLLCILRTPDGTEEEKARWKMTQQAAVFHCKLSQFAGSTCYLHEQDFNQRIVVIPFTDKAMKVWLEARPIEDPEGDPLQVMAEQENAMQDFEVNADDRPLDVPE